jgi:hypothetical protein
MKEWIKNVLSKVKLYITSGKAQQDITKALELAPRILPILDIVAKLTPTNADNMIIAYARANCPRWLDGSLISERERNTYLVQLGAEMVKRRFPDVDTTVALTAVQLAYNQYRTTK